MPMFPSNEWFQAVREVYNADETLHTGGGGACDTVAAFKIGDDSYMIAFEGRDCADIHPARAGELDDADFVIEMPAQIWREMVANVQQNGRADLEHTLNSIDLRQEESIAWSPQDDQYRQDLFYRYNQNFQDFFDASSRVDTTFD